MKKLEHETNGWHQPKTAFLLKFSLSLADFHYRFEHDTYYSGWYNNESLITNIAKENVYFSLEEKKCISFHFSTDHLLKV